MDRKGNGKERKGKERRGEERRGKERKKEGEGKEGKEVKEEERKGESKEKELKTKGKNKIRNNLQTKFENLKSQPLTDVLVSSSSLTSKDWQGHQTSV